MTQPSLKTLFQLTKRYITSNIVVRLPRTFTRDTITKFGQCKIQNIIWGGKLRFKVAYYLDSITETIEEEVQLNI